MKRRASVYVALLVLVLTCSLAWGQASVPNLVNFQGRLTDTSGVPLADGSHNLTFSLFNVPSGGSSLWNEAASVTTKDGLFTHQLGSVTILSSTFFQNHDSLYLEITVEAEIISPRTRLTSSPYSRLSNGLEVWDDAGNDTMVITTIPSTSRISTYGNGGAERFRLHGNNWAQLLMYDNNPNSDLTVALHANFDAGGQLNLYQEDGTAGAVLRGGSTANGATLTMYNAGGTATIALDADIAGDGAIAIPNNAVNVLEILDEPGVASDTAYDIAFSLAGGVQTIASRSINPPGTDSGFVLVIGTVQTLVAHTNGTQSWATFGVSSTAGVFPSGQDGDVILPSGAPTGTYYLPVTVHGLFKTGTLSDVFYLLAEENSGNISVADVSLTLVFIPTAYGIVTPPLLSGVGGVAEQNTSSVSAREFADELAQNAQAELSESTRLSKENEVLNAKMAGVESRLQELERQVSQNQQAAGADK